MGSGRQARPPSVRGAGPMNVRSRLTPAVSLAFLAATVAGATAALGGRAATPSPPAVSGPYAAANLTVFLVHGPDAAAARPLLTLSEALERGVAVVYETGSVNQLAVENRSDEFDIFLQYGDVI